MRTIKLKTGGAGKRPASLKQGEVAINVDNGLWYYGSGSNDKVKPAREWTGIVFKPIQKAVLRTKGEEIMPKKGKPKKKKTGYGKY